MAVREYTSVLFEVTKVVVNCHSSSRRLTQQPWREGILMGPVVQAQRGAVTGPREPSGR